MYETWLIPYLEGTLDAERRAQLEARLRDDPRLTSELRALRRAAPRLRVLAADLRRSEAARPAPPSLWPGLRGRLDARPARPTFGPALWWTGGGLCAAGLLLFAVLSGPMIRPAAPKLRTAQAQKNVPLIVSAPDSVLGTPVARRLQERALRVAAERRAVDALNGARVAVRPTPAPALPVSPPVAAATPPPPAARPLQMAKREPDAPPFPAVAPPAPTHSPPSVPRASAPAVSAQAEVPALAARSFGRADRAGYAGAAPPATSDALPAPAAVSVPPPPPVVTLRQQLEQTLTPPDYGTDAAEVRERDLLHAARPGAALGVRTEMKAEDTDTQGPASGRLLATLDEEAGDGAGAAARWRRLVQRPDAVAEDWFRLARAEAHLGHDAAARQAYTQALQPGPVPLSAAHRATALQSAFPVLTPVP